MRFLPLAAVAAASLALSALPAAQHNVLIVVADDLGVDYVGAYEEGPAPAPTPTIDGLAADGVLFRNAWAYAVCSPTRAAINTGRYGFRTGVGAVGPGNTLDLDELTLPEVLDARGSGYAHAWVGKWHLGGTDPDHPTDAGWSHFAGILGGGVASYDAWARTVDGQTSVSTTYATTQIVDDALAWIGDQDTPWVCVVAFNAPHTPFHAPPPHLHTQDLAGLDVDDDPVPFYRAAVEALDTELGRLLTSLDAGTAASTNVLFLGDNGTPKQVSLDPFVSTHAKGSPYEGGVGVPLVASGPAVGEPGRETNARVHAVDLFATTLELAGVGGPVPLVAIDSVDVSGHLASSSGANVRPYAYAETFPDDPFEDGWAAARGFRFKLIRRYGADGSVEEELYDLVQDPFEASDLLPALTPVQQNAWQALSAHVDEVRDTTGGFAPVGADSCAGPNGTPEIAGVGSPQVGATYSVSLAHGPTVGVALLTTGVSTETWLGLPLPFDLTSVGGAAGCLVTTSGELGTLLPLSPTGAASGDVLLPDDPRLVAGTLYHSWILVDLADPLAGPVPLSTAGLEVTIGG